MMSKYDVKYDVEIWYRNSISNFDIKIWYRKL